MTAKLNVVPFVSVDNMMKLVLAIGVERFLVELAGYIEADFRRWESFDKTPRVASHSAEGVIEAVSPRGGSTALRVAFAAVGRKTLIQEFARLQVIG